MRKTTMVLITIFIVLNFAGVIHAQTRMAPANNPNAVAGQGQAEIVIDAGAADKDIAVWVNGALVAHIAPKASEKIIVQNGRNVVEAADTTANRNGQWTTGTKRQIIVQSNSNRITISLNTRYGALLSLAIQGTVALAPATITQPVTQAQPATQVQPAATTVLINPPAPVTGDQRTDAIEIALTRITTKLVEHLPSNATVAVLPFSAEDRGLAEIIMADLEMKLWDTRGFHLVDRAQIDKIRAELQHQYSGDVDDASAVSIGKGTGANIIITGNISVTADATMRRLAIRALDVQTGSVVTTSSEPF
jgi:hypothetical protein